MSFLNSFLFWGVMTAAAVAVPVVIHLLSRYKSRPLDWAAIELLRRATIVRARRLQIEDLLLLALRCLALLLAGLAFARPAIRPSAGSWLGGGGGRAGALVALDASYSMAHKPGARSRFEMARDRAREIVATLSPGDPLTLVLLGSRPRVLLRNSPYDAERVEAVLKAAAPLEEALNLEICLAELERLAAELGAPSRECYLVTDAQAATWREVSDAARASMKTIRRTATLFLATIGARESENLALTQFALASGVQRRGSLNRYVAEVRNAGRAPAANVLVRLFLGSTAVDERVLERIAPGATESVSLFARLDQPGIATLTAAIGEDALPTDNARHAIADVRDTVKLLCVDGAPSKDPFKSETDFLRAALTPEGADATAAGAAGMSVDVIPAEDLQIRELATHDIVVLANVAELVREQAQALAEFVRRGGGLVVFLGDKTNAELLNARLRDAEGNPLLPAQVGEEADDVPGGRRAAENGGGWTLAPDMPDHPVSRVFRALPGEELGRIHFWRCIRTEPARDATVLLRTDPRGLPLLVEHAFGLGKVLLFASSADADWTDLPTHPAYLMLVQQAVTHLSRRAHEVPVAVSQPLVFDVPPDSDARTLTVVSPKEERVSVRVVDRERGKAAILEHADSAGIYAALAGTNAVALLKAAANPDPAESDVTTLQGPALAAAAWRLPVKLLEETQDVRAAADASRAGRELWRLLLSLALVAVVAESLLARRFVRRSEETPA